MMAADKPFYQEEKKNSYFNNSHTVVEFKHVQRYTIETLYVRILTQPFLEWYSDLIYDSNKIIIKYLLKHQL